MWHVTCDICCRGDSKSLKHTYILTYRLNWHVCKLSNICYHVCYKRIKVFASLVCEFETSAILLLFSVKTLGTTRRRHFTCHAECSDDSVFPWWGCVPSLKDSARSGEPPCPLSWQYLCSAASVLDTTWFCRWCLSSYKRASVHCSGLLDDDEETYKWSKMHLLEPRENGPRGRNKNTEIRTQEIRKPNIHSL